MIYIKKEKESLLIKRHPWIFKGAIDVVRGNPENGDIVPVCKNDGGIMGFGFYSPDSFIAVRMICFAREEPDKKWLHFRIKNAYELRKKLHIPSDSYRLVNAEGDFIPGLIIDVYNKTLVIRPLIKGIEVRLPMITETLSGLYPESNIFLKRDEFTARKEHIDIRNSYICNKGNGTEIINENSINFTVDILSGQKTGFYLDLRDARILVSDYCKNKIVLNLFAYTGAFALHAAKGMAEKVISVEQSKKAIEIAYKNVDNNQELKTVFEWIQDDVFNFFPGKDTYDVIICDPPPFARKKHEVKGAIKGYQFLLTQCLAQCNKNGWLFTFSCSGAIKRDLFLNILYNAAVTVKRDIRVIRELHAAPDHPYSIVHPEGEYLKGWAVYVC